MQLALAASCTEHDVLIYELGHNRLWKRVATMFLLNACDDRRYGVAIASLYSGRGGCILWDREEVVLMCSGDVFWAKRKAL